MNDWRALASPDSLLRLGALTVIAAVAASGLLQAIWGVDLIDHLDWAPDCRIRDWLGFACPGCGMTQALVALGQLEWSAAIRANPAAPCLAALALVAAFRRRSNDGLLSKEQRERLAGVALIAVLVFWLFRAAGPAAAIAY